MHWVALRYAPSPRQVAFKMMHRHHVFATCVQMQTSDLVHGPPPPHHAPARGPVHACMCVCASCGRGAGGAVPAEAADEAAGVVGAAQRRHHLPGDEAVAAVAAGAVQPLVVRRAHVLSLLLEET